MISSIFLLVAAAAAVATLVFLLTGGPWVTALIIAAVTAVVGYVLRGNPL